MIVWLIIRCMAALWGFEELDVGLRAFGAILSIFETATEFLFFLFYCIDMVNEGRRAK